jgi:ethanolamine ammonia-lyase small subunit
LEKPASLEKIENRNWLDSAAQRTPARIFRDRCGPAYDTATQLELRSDHAFALDAVQEDVDLDRNFPAEFLTGRNLFAVQSQAESKREFLLRPDLGRRLNDSAREIVARHCKAGADVQIVLGDGLSATALIHQAPPLLPLLEEECGRHGWRLSQTFLVRYCRVGIMNDVGDLLTPEVVVLLIGERPGLAASDSLSAYLAYRPRSGHTDAQRNLVSNIHPRGVSWQSAAARIAALIAQMRKEQISGVSIKEQLPPPQLMAPPGARQIK